MKKIEYKEGVIVGEDKTESGKIEIDRNRMGNVSFEKGTFKFEGCALYINKRDGGKFTGSAIYLSDYFDWVLCKDEKASFCLVPLKKVRE